MEYLEKRKIKDFNNNLKNIFNLLSINGKYKVLGSSSIKSILYNTDYDLKGDYTNNNNKISINDTKKYLYKIFLNKFNTAYKNPNIWITDFKCGFNDDYNEDNEKYKIRWTYKDMKRGFIKTKNGIKTFEDCLLDKIPMKMDIIALVDGNFVEITENYYIDINGQKNFYKETINDIIENIKNDYNELINDGMYYKSLKRIYSIAKYNTKREDLKIIQILTEFFNGFNGYLNAIKADLELILILLENKFKKVKINDILNNLQIIKQQLSHIYEIPHFINFSKKIDNVKTIKDIYNICNLIINYIINIINKNSIEFYNKNYKILKKYSF
jgi:hypothetical protein